MAKKNKYYVVWQGIKPGIYTTWDECRTQVEGYSGAQYKSFNSLQEAQQALQQPYSNVVNSASQDSTPTLSSNALFVDENGITRLQPNIQNPPILDALAVDAACSGNPGVMEYQGIYIPTRTRVFHYRHERGTNNIGEFLAIVHGLSYLKKHHLQQIIYSDSVNAINWVKQKQCKSKLPVDARTTDLWEYVHRAETWLRQNTFSTEIKKWNTAEWGEIPADFGRK